ncbi:protein MAIN-LIKE 1-like [Vicia villosa]|uniref:protein MAIN-LIKE 1-like n=1 Tax=Vicia villosa TaxID=3911 RepID=UPI00273AA764|nr:protein MAIN-LIKE 1-like [Vicia villosa]
MVNHSRKIFGLFKPAAQWFNDHVRGSGLCGLCMTGYTTISTGMQGAFVERWHKETSSFHLPVGELTITLHDVQCLLHLPIRGPLLDHSRIQRVEAIEWMMHYLGLPHEVAHLECVSTSGPHVRFNTLSLYFEFHLDAAAEAEQEGNDLFREYHRGCALRCWYMHVVGAACFVDKSARYVDVAYLRYFMDLDTVHQWNWGAATLAYLYQKLNEASNWRTRQLVGSCTLLTSWIISYFSRIHGFHIDPAYVDAMPRAARYALQRGNDAVGPYRLYLDRTMHDDVTWRPFADYAQVIGDRGINLIEIFPQIFTPHCLLHCNCAILISITFLV